MAVCQLHRRVLLCGAAVLGLQSGAAFAAAPSETGEKFALAHRAANAPLPGDASSSPVDEAGIDATGDIVVTASGARSRRQVPIAVTALQPARLQELNVTDLVSLRSKLATFDFRTSGHTAGIYLRGVGQNGAFPNNENSVALYVDDVYMGLAQMTRAPFNNIEQLVVLVSRKNTDRIGDGMKAVSANDGMER